MKVSVVIPVLNHAHLLRECLDSVLKQILLPYEIIIVDNSATDSIAAIAHELNPTSQKVPISLLSEARRGAPFARNKGLDAAACDWIQFLDADDLLLPGKLEYQAKFTVDQPGMIISPVIERDENGNERFIPLSTDIRTGLLNGGGTLGYTSSILWNTRALHTINGWDTAMNNSQEYDLMFRIWTAGFMYQIAPVPMTTRRLYSLPGISNTPYTERLPVMIQFKSRVLNHVLAHAPCDEVAKSGIKELYMRYTHLRIRDAAKASECRRKYIEPLITPRLKREYPIVYLFGIQSKCILLYRAVKKIVGYGGILGRLRRNNRMASDLNA